MAFHYKVTLQADNGEVVEKDYRVNWDPSKVDSSEVAKMCAAESTVASGHNHDKSYKRVFAGISAQLLTPEAV